MGIGAYNLEELTEDIEEAKSVLIVEDLFGLGRVIEGKKYEVYKDEKRDYLFENGESYVVDESGERLYGLFVYKTLLFK